MAVTTWTYNFSEEGWFHNDASSGNASTTMAYDSGDKSLRTTMTFTGDLGSDIGQSNMRLDINVPIVNGDTLAADYVFADGKNMGVDIRIFYTDSTNESVAQSTGADGTFTLTMTQNKTAERLQINFNRPGNVNGIGTFEPRLQEVRLTTATPIGAGLRPLEMDIELEFGSKIWTTFWEDDAFFLREYSSDLIAQNTFSIATGTMTSIDVDNRTYYVVPFAAPFFGTANLNDIIYVFGRWVNGSISHLKKSTDGGSSFVDIGDSATWAGGWVGAFFATDASNLFAFVNGASRALYRSTNGGTTWTNLSSLPFDVDSGGVSKHPDGRILISNRDAGAQTAAYAEAPDYPSWIDATGSPSFPASTPGAGSNAIIWIT